MDSKEYSVCSDCFLFIANDEINHENETHESMHNHIKHELNGSLGNFCVGLAKPMWELEFNDDGFNVPVVEQGDIEDILKEYSDNNEEVNKYKEVTNQYETIEFSSSSCELCNSSLAGSRHVVTLVINS